MFQKVTARELVRVIAEVTKFPWHEWMQFGYQGGNREGAVLGQNAFVTKAAVACNTSNQNLKGK